MKMAGVPEGTPAVCVCSELKAKNLMRLTGVVEMAVGMAILKGPTRPGAYGQRLAGSDYRQPDLVRKALRRGRARGQSGGSGLRAGAVVREETSNTTA